MIQCPLFRLIHVNVWFTQLFFGSQSKELFSTSNLPVPTASFWEPYLQLNIYIRNRHIKTGPTLSAVKLIHELKIKIPPYNTFEKDPEKFKPLNRAATWWPAFFRPHLKTKWYSPEEAKHFLPTPPLYHKRMNSIWPGNIWRRNTYLEKAEKGRESNQMLKRASQIPHGQTQSKELQKWGWGGGGVGELHSEFSRSKSHVFYTVNAQDSESNSLHTVNVCSLRLTYRDRFTNLNTVLLPIIFILSYPIFK